MSIRRRKIASLLEICGTPKKMMEAAKGQILNEYGSKGWELVSVESIGEDGDIKFTSERGQIDNAGISFSD